jgi:hypothetical protein
MSAYPCIGPAALLTIGVLLSPTQAGAEEYKTEFATVTQARDAGWDVIRGDLPRLQAPELSIVNDGAVGTTALRVDVRHEAPWQGIQLEESIDLREYAGMEFWLKQNVRTADPEWACAVQVFFEGGGHALANPKMGKGEWTKVYLPFRSPPWTLENQPEGWGRTTRIRFYPYRELDTPGEFLMIDGLRFVPKSEEPTAESQGISYTYDTPPKPESDPRRELLLDGAIDPESQVTWAPYGEDPRVVFDLGEEQTLTKVTLKAHAIPAQNIASVTVEVSPDGERWTAVGSIVNDSTAQAEDEQTLATACLGVGRYVRIVLKRPRVDVSVVLGEVILDRRATIAADREVKPGVYFEGPDLPPVPEGLAGSDDFAILHGRRIAIAVHRGTGVIGELRTVGGRRIVLRGWDRYVFENRDALVESSEYADSCRQVSSSERGLILEATNADLPDLTIRKEYRLAASDREEWLEKTTSFSYSGGRPDQFVTLLTNVALDEAFRRGGYYETAQVRCDRLLADEVHFKHVVPAVKAVMLVRPRSLATVTQYRHKVNGRFCLPYHGQNPMESYNQTSYSRCGWEIGQSTLKLSGEKVVSTQVHTAVLDGGRFGWERHFVSRPDYREYVAELSRPAWLSELKTIILDTYRCVLWGQAERTAERLALVFADGYTMAPGLTHLDGIWGELPISGDAIGLFGGITPTDEVARMFRSFKEMPRHKAGLYMWLTSVGTEAGVFAEHPDWFTATNKDGEPRVIFPQLKPNFGRIMSIPEHQDFVAEQVVALHRRCPQDVWYLDGGNTAVNLIDWKSLGITQDYHGDDFCRRVRRELKKIDPELVVFFNSADDRMADIGFAEIGPHFGKEWRQTAARMYSCKVRQYFDPDRPMSPLYWVGPGDTYLRICTALGFPPSGPPGLGTDALLNYAPYCAVAFETRGLQFSPSRYAPDWREEEDTPVEIYALRAGRGLVLSVISHADEERSQQIGAEVPADVASPGETVYVVHHVMKGIGEYEVPNSDFANRDAYRETGWVTGAVTELRAIKAVEVNEEGWVKLEAELPPGLLNLFSIVREPVYFWSRDALRANFLLPSVRRHRTSAKLAGDSVTVTVTPDEVARELLVVAPPSRRVASALAGGKAVHSREIALHGLCGAIADLPPSTTDTQMVFHFADRPNAPGTVDLSAPPEVRAGDSLEVAVEDPTPGPLLCNVWRDGTLVYAGSAGDSPIRLAVPVQAHDGEYEVEVTTRQGARGTATVTVAGHQVTDNIPPDTPPLERNQTVVPVNGDRGDVAVLSQATLEYGRCRPSVTVEDLTLGAEVPNECVTYYAQSMAGIEVRGLRTVAVRIDHNMYPVRGLYRERHVLYEGHPNAFIGFFLDYATPDGYVKRVALSVGEMSTKRTSKAPEWGAARVPDQYLRLPSTIYNGERVAGLFDLATWAPAGWDGRVWISTIMDLALPSRWLSITLVELNPPAGSVPAVGIEDVSGQVGELRSRTIHAARFASPPTLDGSLDDPAWQEAEPEGGLFVVAEEGEAASQETEIHLGYDSDFVYVGMTAWEREKKGFETTSGAAGRPWWDDAVEFALAPAAWSGEFLHQIVTADAVTYQEIATSMQDQRRTTSIPAICRARKYGDRFTVEAAVPIGPEGVPEPKPGAQWKAQFMRTRVLPDGGREHATWTPTDSFHDHARFGTVVFR